MKEKYNWWTDPKNEIEVKKISWWDHSENEVNVNMPISVIQSDENHWTASTNSETEKIFGKNFNGVASGETKEEAIKDLFIMIKFGIDYNNECRIKYQRWVPFRKGDWKHSGGKWFIVFGINVYFRHGKGMRGGRYIPFTKQNISIHSEWNYKP